jgi:hypothetical protein
MKNLAIRPVPPFPPNSSARQYSSLSAPNIMIGESATALTVRCGTRSADYRPAMLE